MFEEDKYLVFKVFLIFQKIFHFSDIYQNISVMEMYFSQILLRVITSGKADDHALFSERVWSCITNLLIYFLLDVREFDKIQEAPLQAGYDGVKP